MRVAQALQAITGTVFPALCIGCGRRGTHLCRECRQELPYLPDGVCHRCAAIRSVGGACQDCRRLSPALGVIRAAFAYEGAARTAVLALKSRSGRYLAPLLGDFLRAELHKQPLHADLVIPVPLAPSRLRQRGYNQSALLAAEVAPTVGGVLLTKVLTRRERTAQQGLPAAARLTNLAGAIACQTSTMISGRRVLIVDDVVTTGATLSACADALSEAGAHAVFGLAFARDL